MVTHTSLDEMNPAQEMRIPNGSLPAGHSEVEARWTVALQNDFYKVLIRHRANSETGLSLLVLALQ